MQGDHARNFPGMAQNKYIWHGIFFSIAQNLNKTIFLNLMVILQTSINICFKTKTGVYETLCP